MANGDKGGSSAFDRWDAHVDAMSDEERERKERLLAGEDVAPRTDPAEQDRQTRIEARAKQIMAERNAAKAANPPPTSGPPPATDAPVPVGQSPLIVTGTTSNWSRTPAELSPEADRRLTELDVARRVQIGQEAVARQDALNKEGAIVSGQLARVKSTAARDKGQAAQEQKTYGQLMRRSSDLAAKIKKAKIDPDQLVNNMTGGQQFMMALSMLLGGAVEGYSEGKIKSQALNIMNAAIDRNIDAQKANLQSLMEQSSMTEQQKASVWQRWQSHESNQRENMALAMQYQLAKHALISKRSDITERTSQALFEMDKGAIERREKTKAKVTQSGSTERERADVFAARMQKTQGDKAAGTKELPPDAQRAAIQAATTLRALNDIENAYKKLQSKGGPAATAKMKFKQMFPFSSSKRYKAQRYMMASLQARNVIQGNPTKDDTFEMMPLTPGEDDYVDDAMDKVREMRETAKGTIEHINSFYGDEYKKGGLYRLQDLYGEKKQ